MNSGVAQHAYYYMSLNKGYIGLFTLIVIYINFTLVAN
jgi:hypothetical protein